MEEEVRICTHCGEILAEYEGTTVGNDLLCDDCVDELCTTCDHCGDTIWTEDCVTDGHTYLCRECFNDHYRRSQIMPTAAFVENLCREFKKDKSSVSDEQKNMLAALAIKYGTITPMGMMKGASVDDAIIKLLDYTYVDKLMERIRASVLIKYKEWLISDINKSYTNLKSELADYFQEIKTSNDELLSATKGNMEEIEQKFTNAQIEAEAGKQAKDILINLMNDAKEDNQKRIEELKKALMNLTA